MFKKNNIQNQLTEEQKNILLSIVKKSVEAYIKTSQILDFEIKDDRLKRREGAFVTIYKNKFLNGCIGLIVSEGEPLWKIVRTMSIEAATNDFRFDPIGKKDLEYLNYEISVLSEPVMIKDWQEIELGLDGVIIRKGTRSGVFLPQVAKETGWDKETFLRELCSQKAGLDPEAYKNDSEVEISVFRAEVFGDRDKTR